MALQFEDEMKAKLIEYDIICGKIDKLVAEKEKIRDQSKQWLDLNKVEEAYTEDATGQAWKLARSSSNRRKILDWGLLTAIVGDRKDEVVGTSVSNTFKISKVKGVPVQG